MIQYIFYISFLFLSVQGCDRSLEVRGVEDICWTKNVEVIDRLQYTGKSILNFAKKKLGMEVETDDVPQKVGDEGNTIFVCDYYKCIFEELKMLNNGYPSEEKISTWIKNNVIYNQALILLSRVDTCSSGLSKSIGSNTLFSVNILEQTTKNIDDYGEPSKLQDKCDIVAEYTKCVSMIEKNDCPVFQYP